MQTRIKCFFTGIFTVMLHILQYQQCYSQQVIDVTDQTIKIGGTQSEEIMIGFAAGDKIIFNFKELNGKELKEIEIIEYPASSKFSEFKSDKIENKTLSVLKQSVYIFRFRNSALGGRICKINIQRIPANEITRDFNTAVKWMDKQDTTWTSYTREVIIGYDTLYEQKTKKELIKTELREELLFNKVERVHSTTNGNGNKTSIFFSFPPTTSANNQTQKVVSWAYWIGVDDEANKAWQANSKLISSAVKKTATYFTTPLGAYALGAITELLIPKLGQDVAYEITDRRNKDLFFANQQHWVFDKGKGPGGYKKFTDPSLCQGTLFICMSNDNFMQGLDVTIKAVAIIEYNEYEDKLYTETVVKPKTEMQILKQPQIKTQRVPVTGF